MARPLVGDDVDDAGLAQRAEQRRRRAPQLPLAVVVGVRARDELHEAPIAARIALQQRQQHAVRHREARLQRLGRALDQALEGLPIPVHVALLRRLLHHHLLAGRLLLAELQVLDDVLGRLRDDGAAIVEALASGASGDLVEVAHAQDRGLLAVVLAELREEHRANRNVDAHAQRVGAADDLEQALLRQLLDEQAILRQEPGVVQSDAVANEALKLLRIGRIELHVDQFARRWPPSPPCCRC